MRRALLIAIACLSALALLSLVVTAASPAAQPAAIGTGTVTATGTAVIPPSDDPISVVTVQLMGAIDQKSAALSFDGYMTKLERIRQAVIAAGVPEAKVTTARGYTSPNGAGGVVNFNSNFRYEVRAGPVAVAAAQAAFGAGASMVYDNMPAPAVGARRPDGAALDKAVAEAMSFARDYASRVAHGRTLGEASATTLTVKGEPDNAPTQWRVEVTMTFDVR